MRWRQRAKISAVIKPTQPLTINWNILQLYFWIFLLVLPIPCLLSLWAFYQTHFTFQPSSPSSSSNSVFAFVWDFLRIILFFHLNKRGFETARCWWMCWPWACQPGFICQREADVLAWRSVWSRPPVCLPLPNHILAAEARPPPLAPWNYLLCSHRWTAHKDPNILWVSVSE